MHFLPTQRYYWLQNKPSNWHCYSRACDQKGVGLSPVLSRVAMSSLGTWVRPWIPPPQTCFWGTGWTEGPKLCSDLWGGFTFHFHLFFHSRYITCTAVLHGILNASCTFPFPLNLNESVLKMESLHFTPGLLMLPSNHLVGRLCSPLPLSNQRTAPLHIPL